MKYLFLLALLCSQSAMAADCSPSLMEQLKESYRDLLIKIDCTDCSEVRPNCRMDELSNPPEIILVGEDHSNKNSERIRALLFSKAEKRELELATEVDNEAERLPWTTSRLGDKKNSPNIHGIESSVPYALTLSYDLQTQNLKSDKVQEIAPYVAIGVFEHPLYRGAYENLRQKSACRECFEYIDSTTNDLANGFEQALRKNSNKLTNISVNKWRKFLTEFHKQTVEIANDKFSDKLMNLKLPVLEDLKLKETDEYQNVFKTLMYPIRERDFSETISGVLCSGKSLNPLVIVVGDDHAKSIKRILSGLSRRKLNIRYFKSFDQDSSLKIIQAISKEK